MRAVIDTNVFVSALMSRNGTPADILRLMFNKTFELCYDHRMMTEYIEVLNRERFSFIQSEIMEIIGFIDAECLAVMPIASDVPFIDETDKAFYEVANYCGAKLITGNKKHFPDKPFILSPAEFIKLLR